VIIKAAFADLNVRPLTYRMTDKRKLCVWLYMWLYVWLYHTCGYMVGGVCLRLGADRSHWLRRDENMIGRDEWAKSLLDDFKQEIMTSHDMMTSSHELTNSSAANHATAFTSSSPIVHV